MEHEITYATDWGPGRIRYSGDTVVGLDLPGANLSCAVATGDAPPAIVNLRDRLEEYFSGRAPLPDGTGFAETATTPFRRRVYGIVCAIPPGQTRTYREVAVVAGSPRAARAVGAAMAENRFAPLIPCHRVVGSDGALHGYGGGLKMKQALLLREKGPR